jgi:hypothetical protein
MRVALLRFWLGEPVTPPQHVLAALRAFFGQAVEHVRVFEHSLYATCHGGACATTRKNLILLSGSAQAFWNDPELLLHEYFHVVNQWQTGALTVPRYLAELMRRGYLDNRFVIAARRFAARHAAELRELLQGSLTKRPLHSLHLRC